MTTVKMESTMHPYSSWITFVQPRVYLIALTAALWKYGNECNRSWNLSMSTYERKVIFLKQYEWKSN